MSSQDTPLPSHQPNASSASANDALEAAPANQSGQADPQSIVALAVQMLQQKFQEHSGRLLSDPIFDDDLADAIKRARWTLDLASRPPDDTFHAYQLFEEGAEPMSFEAIADRFSEVKAERKGSRVLPTSKNTVKKDIRVIIQHAAEQIERIGARLIVPLNGHLGSPINLPRVRSKMNLLACTMLQESDLEQLVQDPDEVARQLADHFMIVFLRQIKGLNKPWCVDHAVEYVGASHFIQYVCNGLTYSEFVGVENQEQNFATGSDDEGAAETSKQAMPRATYTEAQLVRPYEILLYASQANILPGKYEVKSSNLKEGFLPWPKRKSSLSILWSHQGSSPLGDFDPELK